LPEPTTDTAEGEKLKLELQRGSWIATTVARERVGKGSPRLLAPRSGKRKILASALRSRGKVRGKWTCREVAACPERSTASPGLRADHSAVLDPFVTVDER
jgi:hypothetical protein